MIINIKFWFFRHYWWILTVAFIGLGAYITTLHQGSDYRPIATLLGTLVSVLFFLQRHRIEETTLFRDIFSECNKRYDEMNDALNAIVGEPEDKPLTKTQRDILYDYFNLCGEEYLYYAQGYIFPAVWKAWQNGMKHFLRHKRIATLWEAEKQTGSYYGLPL